MKYKENFVYDTDYHNYKYVKTCCESLEYQDEIEKLLEDCENDVEILLNYEDKIKNLLRDKKKQICPKYNKNGCKFFGYLNKNLNWNGQHALNGGEYHIEKLGYWVDYYEPDLNLVIEWDGTDHYDKNGKLKEKDKIRQNKIENYLNCKFIRIKENNNIIDDIIRFNSYVAEFGKELCKQI